MRMLPNRDREGAGTLADSFTASHALCTEKNRGHAGLAFILVQTSTGADVSPIFFPLTPGDSQ